MRFALTLHKVQDAEIALLGIYGENEVQRRIVTVYEFCALSPLRNDALQVIAKRVGSLRHLLKYTLYHALLRFFAHLDGYPRQIAVNRWGS